jgi:hypothetical protein
MLPLSFVLSIRLPSSLPYSGTWSLTVTSLSESGVLDEFVTSVPLHVVNVRDWLSLTFAGGSQPVPPFELIVRGLFAAVPGFVLFGPAGGTAIGPLDFGGLTQGVRAAAGVANGTAYAVVVVSEREVEVELTGPNDSREQAMIVLRAVKQENPGSRRRLFSAWAGVFLLTLIAMHVRPVRVESAPTEKEKTD